ncbi:thiol:disulfide interchange protein, partial [Campylobacter jejuni]|nr:thiol:disulfide interchange protein [Campylobacter jejuni]
KLARSIVVCAFLAGISASALSEGKEYVILKNPIANADNYSVGLKAMNVSKADFENFLKTPEAAELFANPISQNYGTPAFVVNGKYQIVPSAINSPEALIEITKELSKQK